MADYSNLSVITPSMVARYVAKHGLPTDEMLLEAFERIEPPLCRGRHAAAVRRMLSRSRGRPPKGQPSIAELASLIDSAIRKDVPASYLDALSSRIRGETGLTERQRGTHWQRKIEKNELKNLICGLYRQFYDLQTGSDYVDHPVLGRIAIPRNEHTRSRRALQLAQDALSSLRFYPPRLETMMNVIVERRRKMRSHFVSR